MANLTAAERAFWELKADDGTGLRTSNGWLFNHTVFARDVSMIARWILDLGPKYYEISREVILTLCWHQGVTDRPISEELAGRIHNEYRKFSVWKAPWRAKLFGQLVSAAWGGSLQEYTTYIAVDTTPLFIKLVCAYAEKVDRSILHEVVIRHDGKRVTVRQCLDDAISWVMTHRDQHGLVSVPRFNPTSLFYQVWKDSHTALVHTNRQLGSLSRPVAYLDPQVLSIDALRAAAELLGHDHAADAAAWEDAANELVTATLAHFWNKHEQRFYVALDHDRHGTLRPITTPGSNPGWMLDSTFFDHLPSGQRRHYVEAITRHLLGPAFLTPAGIRSRGLGSDRWLKVADYHGSWTVWPVDSYTFARGLRRQGMPLLAKALEQRIIRTVARSGTFYEYFLVDPKSRVLYQPDRAVTNQLKRPYLTLPRVPVQIMPERQLAWTIASCLMLQSDVRQNGPASDWAHILQTELAPELLEPEHFNVAPSFVPARWRGASRVAQLASTQWLREYVFGR